LPAADPAVVGVNFTLKVALWPTAKVAGRLIPVMLYGAAVVTWLIATLDPPEFVKVSDSIWLLPTCTLPKLRLGAAALSDPAVVAPPVPASGMVRLGADPLLRIVTLPLATPLDWGVKVTLKVAV
jgi:hypothetical protein